MRRFTLSLLVAAIPVLVSAQEVFRGERPAIDLNNVPHDAYLHGSLRIKFKPEAVSFLKASPDKNSQGVLVFNHASVDVVNQQYGVRNAKRVFEMTLQDLSFKARHEAWGFHLWYELELNENTNIIDAVKAYTVLDIIETAEPVYKKIVYDQENNWSWTPADPQYSSQWNYNNTGQQNGTPDADVDLPEAWDIQKGNPNVIVAVMDGGVDTTHPDLRPNLWIGANNRFGYNFVTGSNLLSPENHGCHTAGTIAAVNNNNIGVSGIAGGDGSPASGVRIMSCQVFGNGLTAADFATPFVFAADQGAAISQNSWGYADENVYNESELDAIDYFIQTGGGTVLGGGIVIFAAGNSSLYGRNYPGAYHRVIGVASTNNMDQKASYSTYGQWVDISAPGGETGTVTARGILSTIRVASGSYGYNQGTSMACPHVSGVAALIVSHAQGRLTNDDVKSILLTTTDDHYGVNNSFINLLGTGRLNAFAALTKTNAIIANPTVDTTIKFSVASVNCNSINLTWTKNAANNDVMIAIATDRSGVFGIPSGTYAAGDNIAGGGTVIYKGSANNFTYTGPLLDSVYYYFKIWSVTATNNYSAGKVKFIVKNTAQSPVVTLNSTAGNCQANLTWTKSFACPAPEVIVAVNSTNTFGTPAGNMLTGNSIPGGGTIVYRGNALSFNHTGLGDSVTNYYAVWAASSSVYATIPKMIIGRSKSFLTSLNGTAVSSSQVNLSWIKNSCFTGDVLVAFSTVNTFGNPAGAYNAGNNISGGGTVLYTGPLSGFNHTALTEATTYHYKIWPITSPGVYGLSKTKSVTTLCGSGNLNLPLTDNFNNVNYNSCQWDTVFIAQGSGAVRPQLSLVSSAANPSVTPVDGSHMIKFNSYDCNTGAQIRLVSKPINTNGGSIDVMYRWYHDVSAYTTPGYDGEGVKVQWSTDGNTWNTFDTADRKAPDAASTSGWRFKQSTVPAAALNNSRIRIGFLFTSKNGDNCYMDSISVFNTKLKQTNGIPKTAVSEYTDAAGWTHYNDDEGSLLLSVKKNGNDIGHVNQAGFNLTVGGSSGFSAITNTGTNYAINSGGWKTMNRYYDLDPVTEPVSDCSVRFYYNTTDSINLKEAALTLSPPLGSVNNFMFTAYKINEIAGPYDLNPVNGHTNIPRATAYNMNGFWQYGSGATASSSSWAFGNMGSTMRYAEYVVKHFGGGGIGIGSGAAGALPVRWLSFTGKISTTNKATLTWIVSEETNVKDYEVQVSINGKPFEKTATLLPLPVRNTNTYYYDYLFPETGTYLFRIKQKDLDDRFSYSITVKLYYHKKGLAVLTPNPASEFIEIKGAAGLTAVQLMDVSGKTIKTFAPSPGNIYSLKGISKGIYFVRIMTGTGIQTYKLMIE